MEKAKKYATEADLVIYVVDSSVPLDENDKDNEEGAVYLYRYAEDEEGLPSVEYIADEDEYDAAADRYDELLDEAFYNSLDD